MRPQVLLSALLTAGALVGAAVWVAGVLRGPVAPAPIAEAKPAGLQARTAVTTPYPQTSQASAPSPRGGAPPATGADAVDGILADLEKPGREIHGAALQRARELGDRSIIPRLREMAERLGDTPESAAILDTIDFLNLPDAAEVTAEGKAARAAAGRPDVPPSLTNRWTGKPFVRKE